jgi:rare lipoprotein A
MKNGFVALLGATFLWGLCFTASAEAKTLHGFASYYKTGRRTANGERFNPMGYTAAHRSLPFGTMVRVTNLKNGKSVTVRINDRGPFVGGRVIDLSYGAAMACGLNRSGVARVQLIYQ